MAEINPLQDYDLINTLTFASGSGTCDIRLYRGSGTAYSGTVYYRAGTSGSWTSLSVSGTSTTFPVSSTTMQVANDWNKSGNHYMTPSFYGQSTNLTGIAMSQKAVVSGVVGDFFMYNFAIICSSLTSLSVPDISGVTSVGDTFIYNFAFGCSSLTSLDVPDTSSITSVGDHFMRTYASGCTSLTTLGVPDTSSITSVGSVFMTDFAQDCSSLTSLSVPDTSSITSAGSWLMSSFASGCTSLTRLELPAVGWFASNNVDWSVPSGRLNNLKGYVTNSTDLSDWQALVTTGNTLYTNYIRSSGDVILELPPIFNPAIGRRRLLL